MQLLLWVYTIKYWFSYTLTSPVTVWWWIFVWNCNNFINWLPNINVLFKLIHSVNAVLLLIITRVKLIRTNILEFCLLHVFVVYNCYTITSYYRNMCHTICINLLFIGLISFVIKQNGWHTLLAVAFYHHWLFCNLLLYDLLCDNRPSHVMYPVADFMGFLAASGEGRKVKDALPGFRQIYWMEQIIKTLLKMHCLALHCLAFTHYLALHCLALGRFTEWNK